MIRKMTNDGASERLLPLNREWVTASLLWREVAICRDAAGVLWFCRLAGEDEGWEKMTPASPEMIEAFRMCQKLAGKEPQPWPK